MIMVAILAPLDLGFLTFLAFLSIFSSGFAVGFAGSTSTGASVFSVADSSSGFSLGDSSVVTSRGLTGERKSSVVWTLISTESSGIRLLA